MIGVPFAVFEATLYIFLLCWWLHRRREIQGELK